MLNIFHKEFILNANIQPIELLRLAQTNKDAMPTRFSLASQTRSARGFVYIRPWIACDGASSSCLRSLVPLNRLGGALYR